MTDAALSKAWSRLDTAIRRAAWGMEPQALDHLLTHPDEVKVRVSDTLRYVQKRRRERGPA